MGVFITSRNVCTLYDCVDDRSNRFGEESVAIQTNLTYPKCRLLIVAITVYLILNGYLSQAQFTDVAPEMDVAYESDFGYMVGASTYDFNKDGWDDLTICTNYHGIRTFQNNLGLLEEIFLFDYLEGMFRTPTWIDVDNDGDADFFASGYLGASVLFRNEGNLQFTNVTNQLNLPIYDARTYAACWGDYDNDSFLDLYMSNFYIGGSITNWMLHNNGDFTFTEVAVDLGVDNGVKTTYQSSFFDYDIDGDVDLFVTNDRSFGNALYQNNGDGTFTDVSVETGTGVIMEAMGISFSDCDKDGDFDFFLSNTHSGSLLMQNNSGVFSDIAETANLQCLGTVAWGACFIDYDNNGVDDIYVANVNEGDFQNDQNYFCMHQEDGSYFVDSLDCFMEDDLKSYSVATGDFDNNGYEDFAVTNIWPATVSIWQNNSEVENHWIKVGLTGTISNADAIGATIKVFANGTLTMKQIMCGESFLAQCSQYELFGLGSAEVVDSLYVSWPGGWTDKFYNLNVNLVYSFFEGETFVDEYEFHSLVLCNDSSVVLNAGISDFYAWNTGDSLAAISVNEPGLYSVQVEGNFNLNHTIAFEVVEYVFPEIDAAIATPDCFGYENGCINLVLDSLEIQSIQWNDDYVGDSLTGLASGLYIYQLTFINGCILHENILIEAPEALEIYCAPDSICANSTVEIQWQVTGGTEPYNVLWNEIDPMFCAAGEYSVSLIDQRGCIDSTSFVITAYQLPEVFLEYEPICFGEYAELNYEVINGSGTYVFDFDEANTQQLGPGIYQGIVYDENYCTTSFEFSVTENPELLVTYQVVNAEVEDNFNITLEVAGGTPPFQYSWSNSSTDSSLENISAGIYSCIIVDAMGCSSSVEVEVIDLTVVELNSGLKIYPMPFSSEIFMDSDKPAQCKLYDIHGKLVLSEGIGSGVSRINTSYLLPGIYVLRMDDTVTRILKQ